MNIEKKNIKKNNLEQNKDNFEENKNKFEKKQKNKEKIINKIETAEKLSELKQLIKKWVITQEIANKIELWDFIEKEEIENIFNKIEEIEEIKNIDKYLPKEFRITKEEYIQAIESKIYRIQIITKLDLALNFIVQEINPWDFTWWINIFWSFLTMLDNNLKIIQENTIDIKDSLSKIDKSKSRDKKTLWQKILDFIKELFK